MNTSIKIKGPITCPYKNKTTSNVKNVLRDIYSNNHAVRIEICNGRRDQGTWLCKHNKRIISSNCD